MKPILALVFTLVFSNPAFALIKVGEASVSSPRQTLTRAKKEGLGPTRYEIRIKNELENMKRKDPTGFREQIFEEMASNPADYQSFLYEVLAGKNNVERAKLVAQFELMKAVEKEWDLVKTTILNEPGAEDFKGFKPVLVARLASIMYAPTVKSNSIETGDYRFRVEDWGFVIVSKDLKKVTWKIAISAMNDANKLEPGADKIRIQERGSPSTNSRPRDGFDIFQNEKSMPQMPDGDVGAPPETF